MPFTTLEIELNDQIATIWMNRPELHNAFDEILIAELTAEHGGVSIAAHIDRSPNGLLPVLGFVPPKLRVDLFEVSAHLSLAGARERWPELSGLPLVTASDAHYLADIGRAASWLPAGLATAGIGLREWARLVGRESLARGG